MARLIRHEKTGPQEVKPQEKSVWICRCGLAKDGMHCDGSHKLARQEEAGKLYVYNKNNTTPDEVRNDD